MHADRSQQIEEFNVAPVPHYMLNLVGTGHIFIISLPNRTLTDLPIAFPQSATIPDPTHLCFQHFIFSRAFFRIWVASQLQLFTSTYVVDHAVGLYSG